METCWLTESVWQSESKAVRIQRRQMKQKLSLSEQAAHIRSTEEIKPGGGVMQCKRMHTQSHLMTQNRCKQLTAKATGICWAQTAHVRVYTCTHR